MSRRSRLASAMLASVLCSSVLAASCEDEPAEPAEGARAAEETVTATVRSNVEATIRVNGALAVETQTRGPAEITFVGPTAEVEADRCGYTPQTKTASAGADLSFELAPDPAFPWKLTIRTVPEGAAVTVDGEPVTNGEVTLRGLEEPVEVIATQEGHHAVEQVLGRDDFTCGAGEGSLELNLTLEPEAG